MSERRSYQGRSGESASDFDRRRRGPPSRAPNQRYRSRSRDPNERRRERSWSRDRRDRDKPDRGDEREPRDRRSSNNYDRGYEKRGMYSTKLQSWRFESNQLALFTDHPQGNAPRDRLRDRSRSRTPRQSDNKGQSNRGKSEEMDVDLPDDANEEDLDAFMRKRMGFSRFRSTKNTKVPGNQIYGVRKEKKVEYRQYMNRSGGFNRPLSPSR
ncbi:hypothetical protein N7468_000331 [Penicillium chermesinum]|uniref:U4/U6.U5 small nuclear ribonucleoprotein 27kDa protein domain-containing protein n=1 Tax=Penicillium chermesinum TaxID=63820 RepID=A0A9W9PK33_9EURO|nr:uncharacterized protein N7468_000331 [Penicillium chermesinum]KAJ5248880.1 hypothetical protein N7468_000331 [Penicillium chermesinum]KAJ6150981.1 hypothetical protein N7470_007575 [Penicillium chermesinum]